MSDIVSPVQNISYTNKDFVTIYEELLDLAKDLGSKWDPSLSNESDPGVILLKLNAVIGDKCNYNIDKSVLECFPLSVTQIQNARQLFEQLGYYMKWRRSATTKITINWIGAKVYNYQYAYIQPFTMITDAENNIIYTLLGISDGVSDYNVSEMKLQCNGASSSAILCNSIQGVPVSLTVSGSKLITVENLDSNNRLYFPDTLVAENGVFITNAGEGENYNKWQRKNNLLVENYNNYYYRFGVTADGNNCYIEFPEDVEKLFGEGIYVTYIRTDSEYGNVSSGYLSKFYDSITANLDGENVILTTDVISITNNSAASNGASFEGINEAYRNYKNTVGTFNTLVTLRDYIGAIIESGFVSNCFVCDRTNDVQTTYNVLTTANNIDQLYTYIEDDTETESPLLNAFSIKLYLLKYVDSTSSSGSYRTSFEMMTEVDPSALSLKQYIENTKMIPHDYEPLIDPNSKYPHVVFFRNIYPVNCTITTQTTLNNQQKQEIRNNIIRALYENLSSKQIDFGDTIEYDLVYNLISGADPRIKYVSLFNMEYNTQAVYYDSTSKITYNGELWLDDEYNSVRPSDYGLDVVDPVKDATLTLPPSFGFEYINGELYDDIHFCSNTPRLTYVPVNQRTTDYNGTVDVNVNTFYSSLGMEDCYKFQVFRYNGSGWDRYDNDTGNFIASYPNISTSFGITVSDTSSLTANVSEFKVRLSYAHQVKYDVIAKSILAGTTQFYTKDETFDYRLNQIVDYFENPDENSDEAAIPMLSDIAEVCGNVDITFTENDTTYELRENESLQLYSPNLIEQAKYSNYVKFEYYITKSIEANSNYQLRNSEFIIFYWTESDNDSGVAYHYQCYGAGTIICPSMALKMVTENEKDDLIASKKEYNIVRYDSNGNTINSSWSKTATLPIEASDRIAAITSSKQILSGSKTISIKVANQFTINRNSNYYLYWITKNTTINTFDQNTYVLFKTGETSRMLSSGEYVIYTDVYKKNYEILGEGTQLVRNTINTEWAVKAINASTILYGGLNAIEGNWYVLKDGETLTVVENSFTNIGSGCSLSITAGEPKTNFYTMKSYYKDEVNEGLVVDESVWYSKYISAGSYLLVFDGTKWKLTFNGDYTSSIQIYDLSTVGITLNGIEPENNDSIQIIVTYSYRLKFDKDGYKIYIPSTSSTPVVNKVYLSDFVIKYKLAGDLDIDENWVTIDNVTLNNTINWNGRSILSLNIGPDTPQYLLSNQSILLINKNNVELSPIVGANKTFYIDTSASNIDFTLDTDKWNDEITSSGSHIYTYSVEDQEDASSGEWIDESGNIVNLSAMGITLNESPSASSEISITNNSPLHYPKVLLSSSSVTSYGTSYVPTYYITYDDWGNVVFDYLSMYIYTEILSTEGETIYTSSGTVSLIFPADTHDTTNPSEHGPSRTIKFNLPSGNYILPIKNNTSDLSSLTVKLDGTTLYPIWDKSSSSGNLKDPKTYFLKMTLSNTTSVDSGGVHVVPEEHELTVTAEGQKMQMSILLDNVYKYVNPNQFGKSSQVMSENEFNMIENRLMFLDKEHRYKYNHVVDSVNAVANPIDAQSFNSINHIFNKYTICEFAYANIS